MSDDVKMVKDWLFVLPEDKCVSVKLPKDWHCSISGIDSGIRLGTEEHTLEGASHVSAVTVKAERHESAPTLGWPEGKGPGEKTNDAL